MEQIKVTMQMKRRAVTVFPHTTYNDLGAVKRLRRAWIKQILELGDRWVLAKKVEGRNV